MQILAWKLLSLLQEGRTALSAWLGAPEDMAVPVAAGEAGVGALVSILL